jgi:hypothetical protein
VRTGRIALAALVLVFAAQQVVTYAVSEPYPAIAQPSFSGSTHTNTVLRSSEPRVVARYADGSTRSFDHQQVMAQSPELAIRTYETAFGPSSPRRDDPEVDSWLAHRLQQLSGRRPVSAQLQERTVTRDLTGRTPTTTEVTSTTTVRFGSDRG